MPHAEPHAVEGTRAPLFVVRPNRTCLRGLHFEYIVDVTRFERSAFVGALRAAYAGRLVEAETRLGRRRTLRLIHQFRFEARVPDHGAIALIHRACASPEHREADRAVFEAAIARGGRRAWR